MLRSFCFYFLFLFFFYFRVQRRLNINITTTKTKNVHSDVNKQKYKSHKSTYIHVGTPCSTPCTSRPWCAMSVITSNATIILLQRLFFQRVQTSMVSKISFKISFDGTFCKSFVCVCACFCWIHVFYFIYFSLQ